MSGRYTREGAKDKGQRSDFVGAGGFGREMIAASPCLLIA